MATREENLKKINEELEKLDDDELDKVAGGYYWEDFKVDDPSLQKLNQNPYKEKKYEFIPI